MAFYVPNPYVHADYVQWERKRTSSLEFNSTLHHLSTLSIARKTSSQQAQQLMGNSQQPAALQQNVAGADTHHHHHHHHHHTVLGSNRLVHRPTPVAESPTQQLFKAMIVRKKETLEKYRSHLAQLQEKNLQLVMAIQSTDETTHEKVSHSLDKYHKFKGVISKVKQKGATELKDSIEDLESLKSEMESTLAKMRLELHEEEVMLTKSSKQLHTLLNYKEKDYPLKQVKIEQLQMNLDYLDEMHEREELELEESLQEERNKFERKMDEIRRQLETKASENWLAQMKRSVFARAIHNKVMEKELELQRKNEQELLNDINKLKSAIQKMMCEAGKNSILISPLMKLGKCTSQTEIQLEIPTNQELPV
ncbi:PREDICTED: pre-mRNA-splicing regulator female-lethal(2)D-like [Amphimedon queenslandica]|uniref:Uncharacterized protein n=1 Tax=Amphimedon queenslandica TaxID=400682 RepID=A0A1X7VM17_AMPQE|nr:PREDICTED: pre-mRNA-splicing regulator female-lethal(2)D-like [Amphimedon queenslandica]|eukprot:XP_003383783.1 PREDICTED: pre-mRNA-splicing regulator female-lethal(2)D-like [Amphimedon queenslandica]